MKRKNDYSSRTTNLCSCFKFVGGEIVVDLECSHIMLVGEVLQYLVLLFYVDVCYSFYCMIVAAVQHCLGSISC